MTIATGRGLRRLRGGLLALLLAGAFAGASGGSAGAASFDCATARTPDEAAVCSHCDLGELDVKMATLYEVITHLVAMGQRGDIRDAQRAWLSRRALCGSDVSCLRAAYNGRIRELEAALSAVYSRGPF